MNKSIIQRMLIVLTWLVGAMSAVSAADRFYIDAVNIEPGEIKQLAFMLENSQDFFGFQADITLPEELEFVKVNGKADFKLSSRADASYNTVSNLLANGSLRVGAFSTAHAAFSGNSGALMYANVHASDNFTGGTLSMSEILFVNSSDNDVKHPDFTIELGTKHNDSFYIPDFKIAVGETKTVSVVLDNETPFTAFQTDVYLPEGLNIVANSFKLTSRGFSSHTVSAKSFTDGRTRIVCLSLSNDIFTGNNGALLDFDVTATKDIAETAVIEMKNQIFSMANAREYVIPNSRTTVSIERALVESITFDKSSLAMVVGDTEVITATVLPTFASTKDVEWASANPAVATVSPSGLITAVGIGQTTITATAVDGSGVAATCEVSVSGVPVTNIMLSRTSATLKVTETVTLTATVSPANASDKSLKWESSDTAIATVDADGNITAVAVGNAVITATSVSNPDISADCEIAVIPTPVSEIELNQTSVSLKVGATFAFTASVLPETATNKGISWSSDNPAIASINENGVVTALSFGKTTITATASDGSGVAATATVNVIPTPAESISIQAPVSTEFKVGEIISLTAIVLPENASDRSVVWSSSDSNIATVNAKGEVSAINVGSVVIKATNSAGISSEISLIVIPTLAEGITVLPSSMTLKVNETGTLTVNLTPATTTDKGISFESSDKAVATIDDNGNVTALSIGEAIITATAKDGSNVSTECRVSVIPTPAESVSINYDGPTSIQVGHTAQLEAVVLPEDATDKSVEWQSQNEGVLTVDANGLVSATGLGEAWISAKTTNGQTAFITFNVIPTPVSVISLNQSSVSLMAGDTFALTASISPEDAADKGLVWSSSNNSVATVSKDGVITGVSVGDAKITVSAADGFGASAVCDVNVLPIPAQSIKIDQVGQIEMEAGETYQLTATVLPDNATDKTVKWSSDAPGSVTVDENGLLHAHAIGNLAITATNSAGQTDVIRVNVNPTLAKSIQMNRTTAAIKVSDNLQLTVSFTPESTTDKTVTWKSSDTSVATVSDNGLVTARALGNCIVTATTRDGSAISASCNITVAETAAESIVIEPKGPFTLNIGETVRLTSTVFPETTTDKTVTWQSQTTAVSVDQNGLVTAVAPVENNWVKTTNSAGQTDYVYVTVLPTKVSAIKVDKSSLELKVGESAKITATVEPNDATDKTLVWESDNTGIATVDNSGNIFAKALGNATVTVTAKDGSGVSTLISVSVIPTPATSIEIAEPETTRLKVSQSLKLTAIVTPEDATDSSVIWDSDNTAIATVDANGTVVAVGVGDVNITAKNSSGQMASINIVVEPTIAESLVLTNTSVNMHVGEEFQLDAMISPSTTTNKTLKWTSSNPDIVSIDNNGKAIANALGEVTIEAETIDGSNLTATCQIRVNPIAVESITFDSDAITLKSGGTFILTYSITPVNATYQNVVFSSSDEVVASVEQNGLVTAKNPGTAVITVCAGDKTARCIVSVSPSAINWSQTFECKPGDCIELTAEQENPFEISYKCVRPDGGFHNAEIANSDGKWFVTFPDEGAYILEAYSSDDPSVCMRKTFNVVNPDDLLYINGIYYRYTDSQKSALKVVRGYNMYSGDYVIPSSVNGLDVLVIDAQAFYSCTTLGKVFIEEGIRSIGYESFGNSSLSEVSIPASVDVITNYAFNALYVIDNHYSLRSISLYGFTPVVVNSTIFNGYINYDICELHVPYGTAPLYASAEVWKEFSNIIDDLPAPIEVESVEIQSGDEVSVVLGQTLQLTAKILPENATEQAIEWTSEDCSVATVEDGLITGCGIGQTRVIATTVNDKYDVVTVTVLPILAEAIEISIPSTELFVGESVKAEATISPANTTDMSVIWNTSDSDIIQVSETGLVTSVSTGQAYLYAQTVNGISASTLITVKPIMVERIEIPNKMELEVGGEYEFIPVIYPENATIKQLIWSSSNPIVGEIADGKFQSKVQGETTITCSTTDGSDVTASCVVTVVKYATSITLSEHDITLKVGESFALTAEIQPIDATSKEVMWSSSDESVVTVSEDGLITANDEGQAVVEVHTRYYPRLSDECKVTVDKTSGIETISIDDTQIQVIGHSIIIKDAIMNTPIRIFTLDGQIINSLEAVSPTVQINLEPSGIYIVKIGKFAIKVAIK